jgi:hypothetical protein
LAGFLVRIGASIYALREDGESINDGINPPFEAWSQGVYVKDESSAHGWLLIDDGLPLPLLRKRLGEMTDQQVSVIYTRFLTNYQLFGNSMTNEAIRTGTRLANPPTTVIEWGSTLYA